MEPQTQPTPNKAPAAVVDTIEDEWGGRVTVAPQDGRVTLRGWVVDAGANAFAAIEANVGGATAEAPCDQRRSDVAAIYGSPAAVGFRMELPLDAAAPGRHPVVLTGKRADGSRVPVPVAVSFDVVPPLRSLPRGVAPGLVIGHLDDVRAESPDHARPGAGGNLVVVLGGAIVLRGWAAAPDGTPHALAYAEVDGLRFERGMSGYPRPDVAAELGTARTGYGFRIRIPAERIGLGEHRLRVHAVARDTVGVVGAEVQVLIVRPAPLNVYDKVPRARGRVDAVGRIDAADALTEELAYLRLTADERIVVRGWAGDPEDGAVPARVVLVVDGVAHGPVQRGLERADVVAATGCEQLRSSGFSAIVHAGAFAPGFHRAELIAVYGREPVVFDAFSFDVIR